MTTISTHQLKQHAGVLRRTMLDGKELAITFHSKLIGVLVPHDRLEQERAELQQLRKLAAEHGLTIQAGEVPAT
ncbi:hypothetical protein GCM10010174_81020 [Kutzneria viridogrisea]|uniref:Antitoxin (DNA-binding transcriptional repressor) of toxin-antitoxin stability system n=1 Tax=Kutzneria viridogrisea TaxID=47990 RepID=A0ABR6BZ33_9PSEU|nr:antitoxin (DNA-binding transcriptional repressor) of toxin-antitoxin stability system [Kutzneria viridogrisea]